MGSLLFDKSTFKTHNYYFNQKFPQFDLSLHRVCALFSAVGTGKTKLILDYIDVIYPSVDLIIVVSTRLSFSESL